MITWEILAKDNHDNQIYYTPTSFEIEAIKKTIEAIEQGYTQITITRSDHK